MADYRILVTGSRDWRDAETLGRELAEAVRSSGHHPSEVVIVHGDAQGADKMADHWAQRYGLRVERYPARWGAPCRPECKPGHRRRQSDGVTTCPAAGPYRNAEMVSLGANVCLAFIRNRSRGASGCADLTEKAGIPVRRFTEAP